LGAGYRRTIQFDMLEFKRNENSTSSLAIFRRLNRLHEIENAAQLSLGFRKVRETNILCDGFEKARQTAQFSSPKAIWRRTCRDLERWLG
jgi:hypothetical protein